MAKRANRNAITANFTHVLDSSLMVWSTNRIADLHGITDVSWIHDQAATHAPSVQILQDEIIESAIEMFNMDILGNFDSEISALLPAEAVRELPPVPAQGAFDLSRLRGAKYFFA